MNKKQEQLSKIEQDILAEIQSGQGLQSALSPLIKRVMEAALEGEMEAHLEEETSRKNRRNGRSCKHIKAVPGILN